MDRRAQLTPEMRKLLTCPISGELMSDPVTLVPSGIAYDRKALFDHLLRNPSTDPSTGEDCGNKLQYAENCSARQVLTLYLGDEAFQKYDDSVFKLKYKSLWNVRVYESIAALLYGMNETPIDWAAAQETALNADVDDPVIVGFIALLLHPDIFPSSRLRKDKSMALSEWARAEILGLSVLAEAGNPWAQWLQGMFLDIVEEKYDSAKELYQFAAEQDHALAQNSLASLYGENDEYDMAEYYYKLASGQGHALAQFNLAFLYYPDFELMRPNLEKAASQGHANALYYLGSCFYADSDDAVEQDFEAAKRYFELAARQGHTEAQANLNLLYSGAYGTEDDVEMS